MSYLPPLITPRGISPQIKDLCHELSSGSEPQFVQVTPTSGEMPNDCFPIVERHVQQYGGEICYGWQIWEWPTIMVEAEFHAVWRDSQGSLRDLTPRLHQIREILFLPDPIRRYEGKQVNNVRQPLSSKEEVVAYIKTFDAEFEIMNRGLRAFQHGDTRLAEDEAIMMEQIEKERGKLYKALFAIQLGRNAPCYCGSGKKFKKCCGC